MANQLKEHYLTDCSDVIFDVQKCSKIQIFRNSAPDPTGELTGRAYIVPLDLLVGTRCDAAPLPNNPTPVLGLSITPRFYGSQGQTHYKGVNGKYDY